MHVVEADGESGGGDRGQKNRGGCGAGPRLGDPPEERGQDHSVAESCENVLTCESSATDTISMRPIVRNSRAAQCRRRRRGQRKERCGLAEGVGEVRVADHAVGNRYEMEQHDRDRSGAPVVPEPRQQDVEHRAGSSLTGANDNPQQHGEVAGQQRPGRGKHVERDRVRKLNAAGQRLGERSSARSSPIRAGAPER